jgi:anti-sigma regulatory factor (Ser/Thr protein kinase)
MTGTPGIQVPRQGRWTLPAGLEAAAEARRIVRAWLADARPELAAVIDDLELTASELAANAAEHGTPPAFLVLAAERQGGLITLTVTVCDAGPWLAVPCPGEPLDDERHRGLVLIAALARKWGVRESADGKDVWCELTVPAATLREVA